jgi:maltooligosyltrehalose trehalohydrolase
MAWSHDAVPDPQAPETFAASTLRWDEAQTGRHARLLELYRTLGRLRAERRELTDPDRSTTRAVVDEERGWVRMDRGVERGDAGAAVGPGAVVLLAALGEKPMPVPDELGGYRLLAGHSAEGPRTAVADDARVPPHGFLLLGREGQS